MVGLVTALERKGYITRTPLTGTGRAIDTTITTAGRSVLDTARRRIKATERRLQVNLTSTEHDHLDDLLRQVIADLDRMRTEFRPTRRSARVERPATGPPDGRVLIRS
jgi:DNA-binding MarR family transcriptional regulator